MTAPENNTQHPRRHLLVYALLRWTIPACLAFLGVALPLLMR